MPFEFELRIEYHQIWCAKWCYIMLYHITLLYIAFYYYVYYLMLYYLLWYVILSYIVLHYYVIGISYCTAYIVYYWTGFRVSLIPAQKFATKSAMRRSWRQKPQWWKWTKRLSRLPTNLEGERNYHIFVGFVSGEVFSTWNDRWTKTKKPHLPTNRSRVCWEIPAQQWFILGVFASAHLWGLSKILLEGGGVPPMTKVWFSSSRTNPWLRSSNHFRRTWWWAVISEQPFFFSEIPSISRSIWSWDPASKGV